MSLLQALQTYLTDGKSKWNRFEIFNQLNQNVVPFPSETTSQTVKQNLFLKTGINLKNVKTFIYASEELSNDETIGTNGYPLPYEDNISSSEHDVLCNSKLLDFSAAQLFLSCLLKEKARLISEILPLLIFCDGNSNKQHIYMFCVQPQYENFPSLKRNKNENAHAVVVKAVSCQGPFSSKTWREHGNEKQSLKTVQDFMYPLAFPYHMLMDDGISAPSTVKSHQQYELLGHNCSLTRSFNQSLNAASISIDVSCNKVHRLFAVDPSSIFSVIVNISPTPGDSRSPAYSMFKDVTILEGLLEGFGAENHVKWAEQEEDSEDISISTLDKVKEVIAYFNQSTSSQTLESEADDDEVMNLLAPRQELDFTEKLWDVLKLVQSFQELVRCLSLVLNEIEQGRTAQFWLHEGNNSILAELIKQSYQGQVAKQRLVGLIPLQMLVEMGIDKLQRDYIHFFTSHRLCAATRVEQFFCFESMGDSAKNLQKKFSAVTKLHHVLELASYCFSFLQLPLTVIHKVVRSALQDYVDSEVDFKKTYSFPVSYNDVKAHLESFPSLWKMDVTRSNENGKSNGSACWTTDFPFGSFAFLSSESTLDSSSFKDGETDDCVHYYVTTSKESFCPLFSL